MSIKKTNWISQLPTEYISAGLLPFAMAPTLILLDPRIGPRELRVFLCLSMHANSTTGLCWPSQARLAEMCGYFRKGTPDNSLVSSIIKKLVQLGWVVNLGQRGFNKSNGYRLMTPTPCEFRKVARRWSSEKGALSEEQVFLAGLLRDGFNTLEDYIDFSNQDGCYADPVTYAAKVLTVAAAQQTIATSENVSAGNDVQELAWA